MIFPAFFAIIILYICVQPGVRKCRMQNRYTGDIGDFGKMGLLRSLQETGLSIGVNWYLVPNESHNEDGRYVQYLEDPAFRGCDVVKFPT